MTKLIQLIVLSFFVAHTYASDIIYTWTDEQGTKHYSQQPPEGNFQVTRLHNEDLEPQKIGTYTPSRPVATEQETQQAELAKQAEQIKQQNSEQAKSICDNARHSLNILLTHAHITQEDPDSGEMVKMTEEQKQAAIKENQQRIDLFCD